MPDPNKHPDSTPETEDKNREDVEQTTENNDDAQRGEVRDQGSAAQ